MNLENNPGRTCKVNGKEYIFFSGYSYLGMSHVDAFNNFIKEGIDKYGTLFPSSRNSNTRLHLYEEFEHLLSCLTQMNDTVTFSSGYLAGQSIAQLLRHHKNIFVAPGTHPAINITGVASEYHSFKEWASSIISFITNSDEAEFVLACDSVNILESNIHDFSFVKNLPEGKRIIFLIDDSHGIGILGHDGEGIISILPSHPGLEYLICYSLSKAFNIQGGAVSGSRIWCDRIRSHPNYAGSTSMNPSLVYTFLKSRHLYSEQKLRLERKIAAFIKLNSATSIAGNTNHLPIWICNNRQADELFLEHNIIISSFSYPLPSSKKINRIVINALHTHKDLQECYAVWKQL